MARPKINKQFEKLDVITLIEKGEAPKTPSIYLYNSILELEKNKDTIKGTIEYSNINTFKGIEDTIEDTIKDTIKGNSKKEILKRNIKNI